MTDARTPPHHVDWESPSEWRSHPHIELPAAPDGRVRAPWTRVLALGAAAFALWFLLFAPRSSTTPRCRRSGRAAR